MTQRLSQIEGTTATATPDPHDKMVVMDGRPPARGVLPGPAPVPEEVVIGGLSGHTTPPPHQQGTAPDPGR